MNRFLNAAARLSLVNSAPRSPCEDHPPGGTAGGQAPAVAGNRREFLRLGSLALGFYALTGSVRPLRQTANANPLAWMESTAFDAGATWLVNLVLGDELGVGGKVTVKSSSGVPKRAPIEDSFHY